MAIILAEEIGDVLGSIEQWGFGANFPGHPLREREPGFQRDGFVATDAFDFADFFHRRPGEFVEALEFLQQLLSDIDGRNSPGPGAQQDRDQFGVT